MRLELCATNINNSSFNNSIDAIIGNQELLPGLTGPFWGFATYNPFVSNNVDAISDNPKTLPNLQGSWIIKVPESSDNNIMFCITNNQEPFSDSAEASAIKLHNFVFDSDADVFDDPKLFFSDSDESSESKLHNFFINNVADSFNES